MDHVITAFVTVRDSTVAVFKKALSKVDTCFQLPHDAAITVRMRTTIPTCCFGCEASLSDRSTRQMWKPWFGDSRAVLLRQARGELDPKT